MALIPAAWLACGTVLVYRDVTISDCKLEMFDQEAVLEDSGTDLVRHDFTVTVSGWIHSDNLIGMGPFVNQAGFTGGYTTDKFLSDSIERHFYCKRIPPRDLR